MWYSRRCCGVVIASVTFFLFFFRQKLRKEQITSSTKERRKKPLRLKLRLMELKRKNFINNSHSNLDHKGDHNQESDFHHQLRSTYKHWYGKRYHKNTSKIGFDLIDVYQIYNTHPERKYPKMCKMKKEMLEVLLQGIGRIFDGVVQLQKISFENRILVEFCVNHNRNKHPHSVIVKWHSKTEKCSFSLSVKLVPLSVNKTGNIVSIVQ